MKKNETTTLKVWDSQELKDKMYDFLLDYVEPNAIDMLVGIKGDTEETYKDALYYLTGYRDFDQIDVTFYE